MKQSKFDVVMDYIDENIQTDFEIIKKEIINLIGINSKTFNQFFTVLTGDTLTAYMRNRRLYYAAKEIQEDHNKPICDIALDYGYSDQSSFTRAFTTKYGFPPSDLRQKNVIHFLENNKYYYEDYEPKTDDSRSSRIWRDFERTGFMSIFNLEFIESVEEGCEKFGFDIDTGYAIADLSERLEISVFPLMKTCADLVAEIKSEPDYLSNDEFAAIRLGVRSYDDLQKICEHYVCKYYELSIFMVDEYYRLHAQCGDNYTN